MILINKNHKQEMTIEKSKTLDTQYKKLYTQYTNNLYHIKLQSNQNDFNGIDYDYTNLENLALKYKQRTYSAYNQYHYQEDQYKEIEAEYQKIIIYLKQAKYSTMMIKVLDMSNYITNQKPPNSLEQKKIEGQKYNQNINTVFDKYRNFLNILKSVYGAFYYKNGIMIYETFEKNLKQQIEKIYSVTINENRMFCQENKINNQSENEDTIFLKECEQTLENIKSNYLKFLKYAKYITKINTKYQNNLNLINLEMGTNAAIKYYQSLFHEICKKHSKYCIKNDISISNQNSYNKWYAQYQEKVDFLQKFDSYHNELSYLNNIIGKDINYEKKVEACYIKAKKQCQESDKKLKMYNKLNQDYQQRISDIDSKIQKGEIEAQNIVNNYKKDLNSLNYNIDGKDLILITLIKLKQQYKGIFAQKKIFNNLQKAQIGRQIFFLTEFKMLQIAKYINQTELIASLENHKAEIHNSRILNENQKKELIQEIPQEILQITLNNEINTI